MSRRFILDSDPVSGQYSTFEYDAATDMYLLNHGQKVGGIVEANKADYNDDKQPMKAGLGQRVASTPLHIWFELYKKGITRDPKAYKRWLNDPENRAFRTCPGWI